MVINHGSILQKEYFVSYLKLIMNAKACDVDIAKVVAFQRLFKNNKEKLGKESFNQFMLAYKEIKKPRKSVIMK